jgi:sigma-B regulation protein RsbU (phosphoserine phosphatase)
MTPSGELIVEDRRRVGLVASLPICSGISRDALEPILSRCEVQDLSPGEVLLSPERENHHLFLLLDGRLRVHLDAVDGEEGFPIDPGECIGDISIIDGMAPSAWVVAEGPARVLAIYEEIVWSDLIKIPGMARNFMRQLADRMRQRTNEMQLALEHELRLEHLERELAIAHDIQTLILPPRGSLLPRHPQVDISAMMSPAREVGGDFYDVFALDARRVCIAIGDVSGKGVPAALFMVRAMTLLRAEMMNNGDLADAFTSLNRMLCADNVTSMFVTMLVVFLDVTTGAYELVNGGHNRPLVATAGNGYDYLELPDGLVLGVEKNASYETARGVLARNDVLVLYTDGVAEARNRDQDFYSMERLMRYLDHAGARRAAEVVDAIVEDVEAFADNAPQSDDITLVALRYLGSSR